MPTDIDFLPIIPKEYDPANQVLQYPDILPAVARDETFLFRAPTGENTINELLRVGVNRFSGGDLANLGPTENDVRLADGLGYGQAVQTQVQFNTGDRGEGASEWVGPNGPSTDWPNIWNREFFPTPPGATEPMTYAEGTQKGQTLGVDYTLWAFENSENRHAISSHWPFVKAWCEAWTARLEARWAGTGKKLLYAWNYFSGIGVSISSGFTSQQKKDLLRSPLSSWPHNDLLPGGTLERMNAYCIPMYFNSPELGYETAYNIAYHYYVKQKTGKGVIVFPQGFLENNPAGMWEWSVPEGKYYNKSKLPQEPGMMIGAMMLARVFSDAFVPWGVNGKDTNDLSLYRYYFEQGWVQMGLWVPDGNDETETADPWTSPLLNPGAAQHEPSNGVMEYIAFGYHLYSRTFKATKGGTDHWLKYRLDGGSWYNPVNDWADDVVNAYDNNAPLVFAREKDGVLSVLAINPRAQDCQRHLLEFEFNSVVYRDYIAGHAPFAINITL